MKKINKNPVMLPEIQSDPDYKNTRTPHQTHGKVKQFKKLCIMPTRINQIMLKRKWVLGDLLRVAGGLTRSRRITPEKVSNCPRFQSTLHETKTPNLNNNKIRLISLGIPQSGDPNPNQNSSSTSQSAGSTDRP